MNLAFVGLLGFLALGGDEGDLVVLASGKELRGRVVFEAASELVLRQGARDTKLARAEIVRVESRRRALAELLASEASAKAGDVHDLELLAALAEEKKLTGEAQVFWWRILLLQREHEAAQRALGHVKRGRSWAIPLDGRTVDWDKRFELAKDWGSAWEFHSLHYELHSNLSLEATLAVLLDLERLYAAFYELFGAALEIYDVCRPLRVNVHADAASYPETAAENGRYDPVADVVQVDASKGFVFGTLAHELTHQLLQDTAYREKNDSGCIPPWLDEGLAEYMASGVQRTPGLFFTAGHPATHHFRAQAGAKDPFDLTRVLAFSTGDYDATSDRMLKYAQSYTLVHFLLHGGEDQRAGFLDYLREVYRGKGSATDLKRCLKADWRKLEESWIAYVRGMPL